jgi:RHS repeat-associated protein
MYSDCLFYNKQQGGKSMANNKIILKMAYINSVLFTCLFNYEYSKTAGDYELSKLTLPNGAKQNTRRDKLGRLVEVSVKSGQASLMSEDIYYLKVGDRTTNLVSSICYGIRGNINDNLRYYYNEVGSISEVRENGQIAVKYRYDGLQRLIREDNRILNTTTTYCYDTGGNITEKINYPYTTEENVIGGAVISYGYRTEGWKDQLMTYNGEVFVYDAIGNPTTYRNHTLEWARGRNLTKFDEVEYTYNAQGLRISKTVNGARIKYTYSGDKLLCAERDNLKIWFNYGVQGIAGLTVNDVDYYYRKNLQGDVINIFDRNGNIVVRYVYDAWGRHIVAQDTSGIGLGALNPIRYRGYFYDVESGLYSLSLRYYDPETGRFLNADSIDNAMLQMNEINGLNLYAFCLSNPVNNSDLTGGFVITAFLIALGVGLIVGAGASVVGQGIQKGWDNINWGQVTLDALIGGVSGVLAMTGLGMWTLAGIGAGLGLISGIGTHFINGGTFETLFTSEALKSIGISVVIGFVAGIVGGAGARNATKLQGTALKNSAFLKTGASYSKVLTKIAEGGYKNLAGAAGARFLTGRALNAAWNQMVKMHIIKSLAFALIKSSAIVIGGTIGRSFTSY